METTELVRAVLEAGGVVPQCIVLVCNPSDEIMWVSAIGTRIEYLLYFIFIIVVVCATASVTLLIFA